MNRIERRRFFARLFTAQRGRCIYCRKQMEQPVSYLRCPDTATFDHIVPKCAGGLTEESNLVLACHECNQAKGSDHKEKRSGPTPEEVADKCIGYTRIITKSHLYALERILLVAGSVGLPKAKKDAIWLAYNFWEKELIECAIPKSLISLIQSSGLYLRDYAAANCWEPLYDVDTYHNSPIRPFRPAMRRKS